MNVLNSVVDKEHKYNKPYLKYSVFRLKNNDRLGLRFRLNFLFVKVFNCVELIVKHTDARYYSDKLKILHLKSPFLHYSVYCTDMNCLTEWDKSVVREDLKKCKLDSKNYGINLHFKKKFVELNILLFNKLRILKLGVI